MKHIPTFEQFVSESLDEKINYPEGVKTSGDKKMDKFAKLIDTKDRRVNIGTGYVQVLGIEWMFVKGVSIVVNDMKDHYFLRISTDTEAGDYRLDKSDVKSGEDIYDECQSIAQAKKPKKSKLIG
jgi:hypothetical protein